MSARTSVTLRRGLPRRPGAEPWPVVDGPIEANAAQVSRVAVPVAAGVTVAASARPSPAASEAPAASAGTPEPVGAPENPVAPAVPERPDRSSEAADRAPALAAETVTLRRGLPRVSGGQPWPELATATVPAAAPAAVEAAPAPQRAAETGGGPAAGTSTQPAAPGAAPAASRVPSAAGQTMAQVQALRQGLPRNAGEDCWPTTAETLVQVPVVPAAGSPTVVVDQEAPVAEPAAPSVLASTEASRPEPADTTAQARPGAAQAANAAPAAERPAAQRAALLSHPLAKVGAAAVALIVVAGLAVLASRWFLGSGAGQSFLATYPGEYHLPENAPVGFPAWLGWQHFLNVFLMVLIIRSGLQIRREKRPTAYWTPRGRSDGKVSLTIWFHQSMDLLWLINGLLFMVLLFATGQWMRVIPTSWEVFPNALSAALQYMSLDWPTENGWVNYNSLQQLAYFTTIFIAAPLAAVTGYRMSGMWPKKAKKLSAVYPMELARKLHFPVMLYFVAFILIHVLLVVSTGALRNLNHMYAAQGSTDPAEFADNWLGFWMFVISLAVMAAAVVAARPFVLAPVASLFGKVSSR